MRLSSNKDKLRVLGKSYLTNRDIAILLDIGINQAPAIRQQFLERHPNTFLARIPTYLFVKEYEINEKRIIQLAIMED